MRKEEIERFSKASNDAEFAKMMKSRTLDPEHLEIQTQLRRGIRVSLVVTFFVSEVDRDCTRFCGIGYRSSRILYKSPRNE